VIRKGCGYGKCRDIGHRILGQIWWHTPVIPEIQEVKIGRIEV
jgi:hypothetical protein